MTFLRRNFVVMCCVFVALAMTVRAQWRHIGNSSPEPDAALARDMLEAHNDIRAQVDVTPLRWSGHLAARAQDWASRLVVERQFYHRPNSTFGENLFEINGTHALPADIVGVWASEASDYSYSSNTCHGVCGHYTQLIWRDTREVGCAVARDAGREVWVCDYDPPGNWVGERPY